MAPPGRVSPNRSEKSGSSLEEVVNQRLVSLRTRIEYEAFKAGCSEGEAGSASGVEKERKRRGKKDRRHARGGEVEDEE